MRRFDPLSIFAVTLSVGVVGLVYVEHSLAVLAAALLSVVLVLALWAREQAVPPGRRVAVDYEILSKLGEGGMGEVFRAAQADLRRVVALKMIKPEGVNEQERQRFRREARVLSNLSNPHTIQVFDAGIRDDGSLFYTMELLDGINLDQLVEKDGPQRPARVIHILRQALMSLSEAHECGLVHRDLKPANLMLCRYGGEFDFVKVLDFGLVKVARQSDAHVASLTGAGAMPGTPAFLPPEAIKGSEFVDARADLYSLAAIGYFLLTGRFMFDASSPMAMVQAQMHNKPHPLAELSKYPVPELLLESLERCLEKEPQRRPASARELLSDFESLSLKYPWTAADAAAWWAAVPLSEQPVASRLPSDVHLPGGARKADSA